MANKNAVIGLLRVLLSASTAEFETAMKRSTDSAKAWSRDLKQVGQQATQVGAALTKTLTLPIAGVGIAAAKLAIDFESSFAGVRKTVSATEPELAELATGFRNLSKTIPVNVNELNKIGEAAGQLGIKTKQILGFTEVMAKLGVTTNLSAEEAATSLARFANIMDATKVKAGTFEFDRLGATIVDLGNNFATTEAEIVEFGTRIAGAGKIAGLTEHQVLAIGAAMSSVGVQAEAGGTAVQKVLNKMTESVATGNASLSVFAKTAGMSAKEFAAAFRDDAGQAFAKFVQGIGTQGDAAFGTLKNLGLGNERVIRSFLSLGNAGDLLSDTLRVGATAWQANTALTKEAEERFKTTQSQLTLLGNRVKDVGITLGNALAPAIGLTIRGLNTLIPVLEKMAGMFAALPEGVQLGIVALAGVVAAAGPAIYIFGQLALSGSAIVAAFGAKGTATLALTGLRTAVMGVGVAAAGVALPLTALTAAIVGTVLATDSWEERLKVLAVPLYGTVGLIQNMIGALIPAEGVLADVASIIRDALTIGFRQLTWALGLFVDGLKLIPGAIATVVRAMRDQLAAELERLIELFGVALPSGIKQGLMAFAAGISMLPGALDSTKKAIHDAAEAMDRIANKSGPAAKTQWAGLQNLLTGGFVPAVASATTHTRTHTGAQDENTESGKRNAKQTSEHTQVLELHAKARAHQAAALDFETAAWKRWEQTVSKALSNLPKAVLSQGITGLDPSKLYNPDFSFGTPREDKLGPVGLDPSTINMGGIRSMTEALGLVKNEGRAAQVQLGALSQAFAQLAQVSGGAFSAAASHIGRFVAALDIADQSSASLKKTFADSEASIAGKMSAIGTSAIAVAGAFMQATQSGSTFMKALSGAAIGAEFGAAFGPWGAAIGAGVGALAGTIRGLFSQAGRDAVKDFAKQVTGSSDLNELNTFFQKTFSPAEAEKYWKLLTQQTGRKNAEEAAANIAIVTAAIARQKTQTEEVAAAAAKTATVQQEALDGIAKKYDDIIGKFKGELDSFSARLQAEADAPEFDEMGNRIYGVQEQLDMARKADLEQQIKNAEEARDAEIAAKKDTFAAMLEDGISTAAALRAEFARTLEIPYKFIPASALSASYDASGVGGWESHVPSAALAGGRGGGTAQFVMDGRTVAEMVVPHIPGEVKRLGLRG